MQHGKPIIVTEEEVEEFFKDVRIRTRKISREYTELEKKIIIEAYEKKYVLTHVAEKLHTSMRKMSNFYENYLKEKKNETK